MLINSNLIFDDDRDDDNDYGYHDDDNDLDDHFKHDIVTYGSIVVYKDISPILIVFESTR